MVIFGLKNCDSCRKAARALDGAPLRDIRAEPLQDADWERFFEKFGEALINRKSATWRSLNDDERAGDALGLLRVHPTLMKRPVIECEKGLFLGWGEETRKVLL